MKLPGFSRKTGDPFWDDVVAEFGTDRTEKRMLDQTLRTGIGLANSGDWEGAAGIFQEAAAAEPDYDVPYAWLADVELQKGDPASAVSLLKDSAVKCRRKHLNLQQAGEISLLQCGHVMDSLRLLAQSALAMKGTPRSAQGVRTFLFLAEMYTALGDTDAGNWARRFQGDYELDEPMTQKIHQAVAANYREELPDLATVSGLLGGNLSRTLSR